MFNYWSVRYLHDTTSVCIILYLESNDFTVCWYVLDASHTTWQRPVVKCRSIVRGLEPGGPLIQCCCVVLVSTRSLLTKQYCYVHWVTEVLRELQTWADALLLNVNVGQFANNKVLAAILSSGRTFYKQWRHTKHWSCDGQPSTPSV